MDVYNVKLVVIESGCDHYQIGDEIIFDGPIINTEKSGALCMTALQALYPYVLQRVRELFGSLLSSVLIVKKRWYLR